MSEVVNLRRRRKEKHRAAKEEAAAEKRAQHGRMKVKRVREEAQRALTEWRIDAHRREPVDD